MQLRKTYWKKLVYTHFQREWAQIFYNRVGVCALNDVIIMKNQAYRQDLVCADKDTPHKFVSQTNK